MWRKRRKKMIGKTPRGSVISALYQRANIYGVSEESERQNWVTQHLKKEWTKVSKIL